MRFLFCFLGIFFYTLTAQAEIRRYTDPAQPAVVYSISSFFEITQPANPTTGYRWTVQHYDHQLLNLISAEYHPSTSQLAGSGGEMVWTFQAKSQAFQQQTSTQIQLVYARPWNPTDNPKQVVFNITFQK